MNNSETGPVDWAGRTFGELSDGEKRRAAKAAGEQLSAEFAANADALGAILEAAAAQAAPSRPRHYCIPCGRETEHEREATLPPEYRCGDPDYEDLTKCGKCGEVYQCGDCGAPWDIEREECSAVVDFGRHGPGDEL